MADKNRNQQNSNQSSEYDWNDEHAREGRNYDKEPNYSISENRGYRDGGRNSGSQFDDGGWQSRYERQLNSNREGDFSGYNQARSARQSEEDYSRSNRGSSSGYYDYGSTERPRNLYDRDYEGMNRSNYQNRSNRMGGANYGDGNYNLNPRRNWSGSQYASQNQGNQNRDRNYGRGDSDERSWWDRTSDEVSSWFGDEDAERRRENDKNHRGKGPKNYSRSDDRIKEDVNDRLSDDPFVDATDIEVTVSSAEVTLTGTVDHRSTKRRAEDLAEAVSGVKNVENRLRVAQSGISQSPGGSTSQSSSAVPGSERNRSKESTYSTSK
jgi:osmotically-inducible protein OsmY